MEYQDKGSVQMRVLILSCNTGEGHNAAGQALMERLEAEGETAVMLDYMKLSSDRTSRWVGSAYVNLAKYTPKLFGFIYRAGMMISNKKYKSPVYYANALMAKTLKKYLDKNQFDVIVMPHLFPAETITYMKRKNWISQKTVALTTDYTCIPFWEDTECDAYILPHEDLIKEYVKRGISKEKLYPLGIPVKESFQTITDCKRIKEKLHITNQPIYLIISGSMGFGKIQEFTYELYEKCLNDEHIIVICGNNQKLHYNMKKKFQKTKQVHIIGYTKHVAELMQIANVVYTKPGGLSSTETIIKNKPMIHLSPIPGCETRNAQFFLERGMSKSASTLQSQIQEGRKLLLDKKEYEKMLSCQKKHAKPDASKSICHLMKTLCGEK